jgi:uncharacterized protein YggE
MLAIAALWLAATAAAPAARPSLPSDEAVGAGLVSNAVTVEGTATMEILADACRMEFLIGAPGPTAADALAALKPVRERLAGAVTGVTGSRVDFEFTVPAVSRREERKGGSGGFDALQKAAVNLDYLPKNRRDMEDLLARIIAAVLDANVTVVGAAGPAITFLASDPRAIEEGLVTDAVKDAERRSAIIAKALARRLDGVRSGYCPVGLTVDGAAAVIAGGQPLESSQPEMTVIYTVRVAYALEL